MDNLHYEKTWAYIPSFHGFYSKKARMLPDEYGYISFYFLSKNWYNVIANSITYEFQLDFCNLRCVLRCERLDAMFINHTGLRITL